MSYQDFDNGLPTRAPPRSVSSGAEASQALAAGVFHMNTQIASFRRLSNSLGTPKDTPQLREKLHKLRQQLTHLAKETASKLKDAQESDHNKGVPTSKQLSDAKLARDFKAVLREFQTAQRQAAERETQFAPITPQSTNGFEEMSQMQQEKQPLNGEQRRQELLLVENEVVYNEAVIEERDQGIREIQQQIGEVNEIFKDLAVLVKEQGHMIDDIEANIEKSHGNSQQANRNLVSAVKRQRTSNSLTCWIMVVFAVSVLIFFLIMSS